MKKSFAKILMLIMVLCLTLCAFVACGDPPNDGDGEMVSVTSVTLNKAEVTLKVGENVTLIASILPEDATNKLVIWSSSDESVATVSGGTVVALKEGVATITVKTVDGAKTATCAVTVNPAEPDPDPIVSVTGVTLDKLEISLKVGENLTLTATVLPDNADEKSVIWTSSDDSIAIVSNGKVYAQKVGTAVITVKTVDGAKTATCAVIVNPAEPEPDPIVSVTGVMLDKSEISLKVGENLTLTATVLPDNADEKSVIWTSSDDSIAIVSNGKVYAQKAGTAVITVKTVDGAKTATCVVIVKEPDVLVESVVLSDEEITLEIDGDYTFTYTVFPENATNKDVVWSVSDDTVLSIADGKIVALKDGTATVTVKTVEGEKIDECKVTVLATRKKIPVSSYKLEGVKQGENVYEIGDTVSGMLLTEEFINVHLLQDNGICIIFNSGNMSQKLYGTYSNDGFGTYNIEFYGNANMIEIDAFYFNDDHLFLTSVYDNLYCLIKTETASDTNFYKLALDDVDPVKSYKFVYYNKNYDETYFRGDQLHGVLFTEDIVSLKLYNNDVAVFNHVRFSSGTPLYMREIGTYSRSGNYITFVNSESYSSYGFYENYGLLCVDSDYYLIDESAKTDSEYAGTYKYLSHSSYNENMQVGDVVNGMMITSDYMTIELHSDGYACLNANAMGRRQAGTWKEAGGFITLNSYGYIYSLQVNDGILCMSSNGTQSFFKKVKPGDIDPVYETHSIIFMVGDTEYHVLDTAGNQKITLPDDPENIRFAGWILEDGTSFGEKSLLGRALVQDLCVYADYLETRVTIGAGEHGYGLKHLETAIERFNAQNNGITVELAERSPNFDQKAENQIDTDETEYDILYISEVYWKHNAIKGKFVALDDVYSAPFNDDYTIEEAMLPDARMNCKTLGPDGREHYYNINSTMSTQSLVINKSVTKFYESKSQWKSSVKKIAKVKTIDDLNKWVIEIERLSAIYPFTYLDGSGSGSVKGWVYPGQHKQYFDAILNTLWAQCSGINTYRSFFEFGGVSVFSDNGRYEALKAFESMDIAHHSLNCEADDSIQAQNKFLAGRAAIIPNGDWISYESAAVLQAYCTEIEMIYVPKANASVPDENLYISSAGAGLCVIPTLKNGVPNDDDNIYGAKEFLKFLFRQENGPTAFTKETGALWCFDGVDGDDTYATELIDDLPVFNQNCITLVNNARARVVDRPIDFSAPNYLMYTSGTVRKYNSGAFSWNDLFDKNYNDGDTKYTSDAEYIYQEEIKYAQANWELWVEKISF